MLYQLVLITNLGMITPIATFPDRNACIMEQALISKSAQYSATCLPTESPEQLVERMNSGLKVLVENIHRLQEKTK
jgi:hypothetical protein